MRWLIAEDEADIRTLLALMCQVWGHDTLLFESGQLVWEWLDKVEQNANDGGEAMALPNLVLMDIRMPGKRGNELAHRMRALPAMNRVPIVLMTAFSLSESEREAMMTADGVDLIIGKPLPDFEELRTLLTTVADQKQATATNDNGVVT